MLVLLIVLLLLRSGRRRHSLALALLHDTVPLLGPFRIVCMHLASGIVWTCGLAGAEWRRHGAWGHKLTANKPLISSGVWEMYFIAVAGHSRVPTLALPKIRCDENVRV